MVYNNSYFRRAPILNLAILVALATTAGAAPDGAFVSHMDDLGDGTAWRVSNFDIGSDTFRTAWRKSSVTRDPNNGVSLALVPAPTEADKDFFGAEVQRNQRTHFGYYEVVMTAARGEGVISSFFTYTGPFFGDPHDEIDIEFLGRDTTKVWLNRFVAGERLPGQWLDLGFDAADGPHLYSFEWLPDRVVWSVDGRELLHVTSRETAIPQIPQRIYLNIWAGGSGQRTWSGEAPEDMRSEARYYCVSYRPPGSDAPMCSSDEMPKRPPNG